MTAAACSWLARRAAWNQAAKIRPAARPRRMYVCARASSEDEPDIVGAVAVVASGGDLGCRDGRGEGGAVDRDRDHPGAGPAAPGIGISQRRADLVIDIGELDAEAVGNAARPAGDGAPGFPTSAPGNVRQRRRGRIR